MKPVYRRPGWAINQVVRRDRDNMLEDTCQHGIGHPNRDWLRAETAWLKLNNRETDGLSIHGCDGCCSKEG